MSPITFSCSQVIPKSAVAICTEIADMSRWSEFNGHGPVPGIANAEYETRTPSMVGSRIRVQNEDGSTHVEEILAWEAGEKVVMRLQAFASPLSHLVAHIVETWSFAPAANGTLVTRSFEMVAKSGLKRPFVWLISLFFRRAIAAHLDLMAAA